MPGSIKIDDGAGRYTILTNGGSLGSDKTITIPNTTGTMALTSDSFGKVLQVVTGTLDSAASTTSSSYVDTGLTASITCSATSSKVLVLVAQQTAATATSIPALYLKLLRDSTSLGEATMVQNGGSSLYTTTSFVKLDSPSSTSALTYKTQFKEGSNGTAYVAADGYQDNIVLIEIGA